MADKMKHALCVCFFFDRWRSMMCHSEMTLVLKTFYSEKSSRLFQYNDRYKWWNILEFYTRPQSGQFYMINVLGNQWVSVTSTVSGRLSG